MWAALIACWVLNVAVALMWRDVALWCVAAMLAAAPLVLFWRRDFPHRRKGVLCSWIGPLILLLIYLAPGDPAAASGDVVEAARGFCLLMARVAWWGSCEALVVAWLLRGYGLVPLVAVWACLMPNRSRWTDAEQYPPRWWWVVPMFMLAKTLVIIMVIGFVI